MKSIQQLENKAREYITQNDFQSCIRVLNEALEKANSVKPLDLVIIARLLNNLGFAFSGHGQPPSRS